MKPRNEVPLSGILQAVRNVRLAVLVMVGFCAPAQELNTLLMNSTFEVLGPSRAEAGKINGGTVFVLGRPIKDEPGRGYNVLITAAHVLDEIAGDDAVLLLRNRNAAGMYEKFQYPFKIRKYGSDLYYKHADADVAAMYVNLPRLDITLLTTDRLVGDVEMQRLEIHPGDVLFCLGFPLFADNNGFAVLRGGVIASYPLTPAKTVKQYLYDFHVLPGNSGGPVYFSYLNRTYGGAVHLGDTVQGVVGLVVQLANSPLPEFKGIPLDVGVVVPAAYIIDTLALLPEAPPPETFMHMNLPRSLVPGFRGLQEPVGPGVKR
jgi:hypothetical protein